MEDRAEDIAVHIDADGVATVTIDRAAKRNALRLAMWRRLGSVFTALGSRADVRSILLTGNGGHFCAGADVSEFSTVRNTIEAGRNYEAAAEAATLAIRDCAKPTIAAISGFGLGGGCGIALACDIRAGDTTTRMGIPAARLGNVYGTLDCDLLLRQVGLASAKLVLFTGRHFDVDECQRMGLVDVVGEASALDAARVLASNLGANAPISIKGAKIVLEALQRGETGRRQREISAVIDEALSSADYRDAARSFVEKRKPVFTGR